MLQVPLPTKKPNSELKVSVVQFLGTQKMELEAKVEQFLVRSPTRRRTLTVPKMHSRCWKVRSRHLKSTKQRYFCEWYYGNYGTIVCFW